MQRKDKKCCGTILNKTPYPASQESPYHDTTRLESPRWCSTHRSEGDFDGSSFQILDSQGQKLCPRTPTAMQNLQET